MKKKTLFIICIVKLFWFKKSDLEDIIVIFKKYAIEILEKARY